MLPQEHVDVEALKERIKALQDLLAGAIAEIDRLKIDGLTGFYRPEQLDGPLAELIRVRLHKHGTRMLLQGKKWADLTEEDRAETDLTVLCIDMAFLGLYNNVDHALGSRVLRRFAEVARKHLHGLNELTEAQDKNGHPSYQPRHYAVRYGGDEFVFILSESPEDAYRIVEAIYDEFRGLYSEFFPVKIPPHVDFGYCHFHEAIEAYVTWTKSQPAGGMKTVDELLTFVKSVMLGVADTRGIENKRRSRLSLLARLYMTSRKDFNRMFPFIAKGAGTFTRRQLNELIEAAKRSESDARATLDRLVLDEKIRDMLDRAFETTLKETEESIRDMAGPDGAEHYMRRLITCTAHGELGRFLEGIVPLSTPMA